MVTGYSTREQLDCRIFAFRHRRETRWLLFSRTYMDCLGEFETIAAAKAAIQRDALENTPDKVVNSRWFDASGAEDLSW